MGSGYFRAIGAADVLIDKAQEIDQAWLRGIGVARQFMRKAALDHFGRPACDSPPIRAGNVPRG